MRKREWTIITERNAPPTMPRYNWTVTTAIKLKDDSQQTATNTWLGETWIEADKIVGQIVDGAMAKPDVVSCCCTASADNGGSKLQISVSRFKTPKKRGRIGS